MAETEARLSSRILSVPWSIRVTALPDPGTHFHSQSMDSGTEARR